MSDDKYRMALGRLPGEPKKRHTVSGEVKAEYDKTTKKIIPVKSLSEEHIKTLIGGSDAQFPVFFDVSSQTFMLDNADFLKSIPPSLFKMYKFNFKLLSLIIHSLIFFYSADLSNNRLKNIPIEITAQKNLKYFYCNNNLLTSIKLPGLTNLRNVSLSHNKLTLLKETLSIPDCVKYLDLSHNSISADFDVLSKVKGLTVLDLSYNAIDMSLPEFHK